MKIRGLLIGFICMIGLAGCVSKFAETESINQFVEVKSSNGEVIGTIVNSDDVKYFFDAMKLEDWRYIEKQGDFNECIYKFVSYELIVYDNEKHIRKDPYDLYKKDEDFFIVQNDDVISIPKSTGKFLTSIEDKITITKFDANEILNKWENSDITNSDNDDIINKKEDAEQKIMSKYNKIIISNEGGENIEINDKSEINAFIERLDDDNWKEIDNIPDDAILRRRISAYSFGRRSEKNILKEMYRITLYETSNKQYFIEEVIPDNGTQGENYIQDYSVPQSVAEFIMQTTWK